MNKSKIVIEIDRDLKSKFVKQAQKENLKLIPWILNQIKNNEDLNNKLIFLEMHYDQKMFEVDNLLKKLPDDNANLAHSLYTNCILIYNKY
jgi:dethiobiotin synthetase